MAPIQKGYLESIPYKARVFKIEIRFKQYLLFEESAKIQKFAIACKCKSIE